MTQHRRIVLSADSPHIGTLCPVRHKEFKPGDSVVDCQEYRTVISSESVSYLDGYCPLCGNYVDIARPPSSGSSRAAPTEEKPQYSKPERRLSIGKWVIPLAAVVLVGGICLAALGIGAFLSSRDNEVTYIAPTTEVRSGSLPSPTDIPTSRPDPTTPPTPTREEEPTQAVEPEPTELVSQADIEDLLERWERIHHQADRTWDTSDLDTVLRGDALDQQRSVVGSLEERNCYWIIEELIDPQITRFDVIDASRVVVEVNKSWDMDLYCNGNKSGDDDGPFTMWYNIERIGGQWYITQKRVIDE